MTTPVYMRKAQSAGERMEMTTPVITRKVKLLIRTPSASKYLNVFMFIH